jgi:hypothetical protein
VTGSGREIRNIQYRQRGVPPSVVGKVALFADAGTSAMAQDDLGE